jgi:Uma2 family endonuclease
MVTASLHEAQAHMADDPVVTEAEYAALGEYYEVVDGRPVERTPMSTLAVVVRDNIYNLLRERHQASGGGYLFGDGVIYLMWKAERGLKGAFMPDISFIRAQNRVADWDVTLNYPGVPDLAVEVVSPTDTAELVMTKARRYLERGTEQVWLVFPGLREIYVYRRESPDRPEVLRGEAMLDASDFFPDARFSLAACFALPALG